MIVIQTVAIEPRIQFRSKSIVAYNRYHPIREGLSGGISEDVLNFKMSEKFRLNAEKLKSREKYTGQMTKGAKKRLSKAISLLVQSSERKWVMNSVTGKQQYHQLSFITLTLPNVEAAKDAKYCHKELLQPLLRIMRNKYKMESYVWKCELQKNGSIHYHITTELFIPWYYLRQHWNALLNKNGLLEAFQKQYGHDNPNSVDVHSVNKVNDLEAYLIKYISKEYQNDVKLAGKVWDCSKNLKAANYYSTELTQSLHEVILKEIDGGWLKAVFTDHCVIMRAATTDYYLSFHQKVIDDYYLHLKSIRKWEKSESTDKSWTTGSSNEESRSSRSPSTSFQKAHKPVCVSSSAKRSTGCQMTFNGIFSLKSLIMRN